MGSAVKVDGAADYLVLRDRVYNAQAKTMDVYLNGELDNGFLVGPVTGSQTTPQKNVSVGRRSDSDGNFAGEIADVRTYPYR